MGSIQNSISKKLWLFLGLLLTYSFCKGQGIPFSKVFDQSQHRGGAQNWDFDQDRQGKIYIANNSGVLIFDGHRWETQEVPNQTIVRTLFLDSLDRIAVGAQGTFGFFQRDQNQKYQFNSLTQKLIEVDPHFSEVMDLKFIPNHGLFFRTTGFIHRFKNGDFSSIKAQGKFLFLQKIDQRIFAQDSERGILEIKGQKSSLWLPLPDNGPVVLDLVPFREGHLIAFDNGEIIFKKGNLLKSWDAPIYHELKQARTSSILRLKNGQYLFGTAESGIYQTDSLGSLIFHLKKDHGLENNTVYAQFEDRSGNIWVATNSGIEFIELQSPFSYIKPDMDSESQGYKATFYQGAYYFSTNSGLFRGQTNSFGFFDIQSFMRIPNTEGQTYGTDVIDDQLFIAHHKGPKVLAKNFHAKTIAPFRGAWKFLSLPAYTDFVLAGSFDGIHLFRKKDENWVFDHTFSGFSESSRFLVAESDSQIWMAHPYKGIFLLNFSNDFKKIEPLHFDREQPEISENFNKVFSIHGENIISTAKGLYTFNKFETKFNRLKTFDHLLDEDEYFHYLKEAPSGEIWFVSTHSVGYFFKTDSAYQKKVLPFLKGKTLGGFESFSFMENGSVAIGTNEGFIFYNPNKVVRINPAINFNAILDENSGQKIYIDSKKSSGKVQLTKNQKNLTFQVYSGFYPQLTEYRYKIQGLNNSFTKWDPTGEFNINNLPYGESTLHIQARNSLDSDYIGQTKLVFTIAYPWYQSVYAYTGFTLISLLILGYLIIGPKKKFEKEREILEKKHQKQEEESKKQVERTKLELAKIKQEKLKTELEFKNKELISNTLHLVHKGEILDKIKQSLQQIPELKNNEELKKSIRKIIKMVDVESQLDEEWDQFTTHFDQVNNDFIKRLRESYPKITPKDQRLCVFLRMNLSSKEIARLLNITIRGVEVSRYRLRKKLNLNSEVNLNEFLIDF